MQLAAARGTEVRDFEFEVELPSGKRRTLLGNATPLRDGQGSVRGCVGAFVDISEREEAERAVRVSEERFRRLVEVSSEIVWVANGDGEAVEDSPSWRAFTGRSYEEWAGWKWLDVTHPDDRERLAAAWRRAVETRTPYHVELRQLHASGVYRHVECRAVPVLDVTGAVREWVGMNVDVTDRKEAERALASANEQLRDAGRKKDEFLAMLSHELRNPLAPIRNSVAILNRASPTGEQAARARAVIARQVDHLARLVDDLLDVTRIARGKIQMRRERVDVVAVLQRAAEDHRPVMYERGVSLGLEIPAAPAWVDGDATRLSQVFGNVLQNAAKFTDRGGRVTVGALAAAGRVEVRVADDGRGIPRDLLEVIFEPFVQADQSLDRAHGGLGLGLALVKAITGLHGGTVRAESDGPGHGATFLVSLPLARAESATAPAPPARGTRHPRRVLVVDDNQDAADSLVELVRLLGHTPTVAYDGATALEAAASIDFDVVFCDLGLPGMDGFTVARRLRELGDRGRALRLVAVSGYAQADDLARAQAAGFDRHLAKPADPADIERLLTEADAAE